MKHLFLLAQLLPVAISICRANYAADTSKDTEINYCDASQHGSCSVIGPAKAHVPSGCFRAAVYEHERKDLATDAASAEANLAVFQDVAKVAAQSGANIIVFPEDGIVYGSKAYLAPGLTEIPNPELLHADNNNPCNQPELFEESYILRNLSCIAKENNLYLVANFGTKQVCKPGSQVLDQVCPDIGYLALNTDVVFDPEGGFIKRYRKYNMFIEVFDKAPSLEHTFFDTPLGRLGLITCFDIMFKRPAIDLVEQHKIDTLLFPTFWYDELPLLSAVQFQDAWSWTNNVNLLGANIHKLYLGSVGSGIFSGLNSIHVGPSANGSKLMIATIPKKLSSNAECNFNPLMVNVQAEQTEKGYSFKHYQLNDLDIVYTLKKNEDSHTICTGAVCCTIDYKIHPEISPESLNRLVFIARDSPRPGHFNWYEQVCALATLQVPVDYHKINETLFSTEGIASFARLKLTGTFNARHVYLTVAYNPVSELMPRKDRDFSCDQQAGPYEDEVVPCNLIYKGDSTAGKPIYTFGMYGRLYGKDKMPEGW